MNQVEALQPFGKALLDYYHGETGFSLGFIREDGEVIEIPTGVFFTDPDAFSTLDRMALSLCKGRILDVGAGSGRHSMVLQKKGHSVCAIDVLADVVKLLRARGMNEVHCVDILNFNQGPFDTILLLGHGLGIAQTLDGLNRLLKHLRTLLVDDGIILCDSLDVSVTDNTQNLAYQQRIMEEGRYRGEVKFQLEYKGERGPLAPWLHVDPDMLAQYASANQFNCEILHQEHTGDFLARLWPAG